MQLGMRLLTRQTGFLDLQATCMQHTLCRCAPQVLHPACWNHCHAACGSWQQLMSQAPRHCCRPHSLAALAVATHTNNMAFASVTHRYTHHMADLMIRPS